MCFDLNSYYYFFEASFVNALYVIHCVGMRFVLTAPTRKYTNAKMLPLKLKLSAPLANIYVSAVGKNR